MNRPEHPAVDSAQHLTLPELMASMCRPHEHSHQLRLIVQRELSGARKTPAMVMLTPERGVEGDRWSLSPLANKDEQLAVMEERWLSMIANGQSMTLAGDNLVVDAPLEQLEIGQTIQLGEATLIVSPEPHNGCSLFAKRFGHAALRWTLRPEHSGMKLRGIYCTVVEPGVVTVGDLWRPS